MLSCSECPSRTWVCSDFYDPDSPSNAIDYYQLASFVFPKCKNDAPQDHSNVHQEVLKSEDDAVDHHDFGFVKEEEFSVNFELDFSSEEDGYSQQQESNTSYKFLTYPKAITLLVTLFLVWFQWMCNHTILTLSIAMLFVAILSVLEQQSRTNISLSKANEQLQEMVLQRERAHRQN
ncbi:hypothetical protein C9374_000037 [Naegleria lovaniensis]|uniref:Uncharacterized protein n=1 Tax=Naegleria lovaniensis TaxID=51637 RepID=A0AA88KNJ8_NAELO|nr:uncharacterized protein C9374_000037 [Naegleria lovaniensis]KAG2388598.1 hypothetical protein C9374_000037 [Naegleria lovaniensis]